MGRVVLVGHPNSGKTSIFNKLTGQNQKVGNYSGVTVEKRSGSCEGIPIIDLPGLVSLQTSHPDEKVSKEFLVSATESDRVIYVANGLRLEEDLILFSQIADLQIPLVLVLNFKDEILKSKIEIDFDGLSASLGCDIVVVNAKTGENIDQLKSIIKSQSFDTPNTINRSSYDAFDTTGVYSNSYLADVAKKDNLEFWDIDNIKRRRVVSNTLKKYVNTDGSTYLHTSNKIDKVLLHPIWGSLFFVITMFIVFQSVFSLSAYPMDVIDGFFSDLADRVPYNLVKSVLLGLGAIFVFIPPIAILFFMIGLLERSGYLSRISFLADAFLRKFGLSGDSVIPLMSSMACAIPAIMGARVVSNPKERFAVIMAAPLMTCSARLPVYTVLIAAIVPSTGLFWGASGLMLFGLYLLGILSTLVVALIVRKYQGVSSDDHFILELPVYRSPNMKSLLRDVYRKTKSFVTSAGKIILVISILLYFLAEYSPHDTSFLQSKVDAYAEAHPDIDTSTSEGSVLLEYSYLGYIGKGIEPIVKPLGYDWKIGIALVSSFAAREVFASTLMTIYSVEELTTGDDGDQEMMITERFAHEISSREEDNNVLAVSLSLLIFYVFALQCMSTVAIVKKETNSWKYPMIQFFGMLALAFIFSFITYQLAS